MTWRVGIKWYEDRSYIRKSFELVDTRFSTHTDVLVHLEQPWVCKERNIPSADCWLEVTVEAVRDA